MTTEARIYLVKDSLSGTKHLVRATNPAQALRYVSKDRFTVAPAKVDEIVTLLGTDIKVENATLALEAVNAPTED